MRVFRLIAGLGVFAIAGLASSAVRAKSADCLLEIDGRKIIDGVCQMTLHERGSFEIASFGPAGLDYFASVDIEAPGRALGYWNENRGASRTHAPFGVLSPSGACWMNAHIRLCAWKIGEPRYFVEAPPPPAPPSTEGGAVPRRVGQCVATEIATLGSRLEGAPDSGAFVSYSNGIVGVSYEIVEAVRRSRVGDPINLCLVSAPSDCFKSDDRGKVYSAMNKRTGQGWSLPDSEHMCGGA